MAFIEDFYTEDYTNYFDVPDGEHGVEITLAQQKVSKSQKRMIAVELRVDGSQVPYTENYCEGEYFNRNMSRFFDAFGIRQGNFNFPEWKGKKGVALFEHKEETFTASNGMEKTVNKCRMKYLCVPDKAPGGNTNGGTGSGAGYPAGQYRQTPAGAAQPAPATQGNRLTPGQSAKLREMIDSPMFNESEADFYRDECSRFLAQGGDPMAFVERVEREYNRRKEGAAGQKASPSGTFQDDIPIF